MFNNLIKWNNGRTTTKILATLLVITLTFANFALLGSYMGEAFLSHAANIDLDNQDNKTNVDNVKFDVYLDANDRNKKQISKDINSDDLNLFISISVQGGGRLENPKVEFSNSNFELKDNNGIFERNIETISSGNGITIGLPIIARKNSSYDLSLLNMYSEIYLSGEYIDDNGNVTDIKTTKMVNIEWLADEITEEQVELSQEIITNKIYNIDGVNKRIVQVLLKTNIQGNIAPIKSTKIEIEVPEIGVKPEQVKIVANNTLATNGKTNIEFGDLESSKYEYNEEEGKINVEVLNNPNSNNIISWQKNVADEYIITYVYDEKTEILPFISKAKSTIDIYGRTKGEIVKQSAISLENIEEIGDVASLENTITEKIYKGNMYIGEESNYETKWNVFVTYSNLAKRIILQDLGDTIDTDNLATYYKSTKINKAKAIDLLGEEGIIKVYDATNTETPITEIKLSEENQEEYYTINYGENINKIIIETTEAVKEGKLEIINGKTIKVLNKEKIETATKIDSGVKLIIADEQNNLTVNLDKSSNSNLVEPVTTIDIVADKTSISNQTENTLRLTAVLEANNPSNKLFKNPTINIELPKEITEVSIENKALLDDELKIVSSEILTNENGNKVIQVIIEGEQTKYTSSIQGGANLVLDLKVKAEEFIADKNVEIKTTCINDGENAEKTNKIDIVSKFGILNKSSIKIGENAIENINKNIITSTISDNSEIQINTKIINNNGQKVTNANLIGTIPEGAKLKNKISTSLNNEEIYYSSEENPSETSDGWKTEIEDYSAVRAFKIQVGDMEQGALIEVAYNLELKEEAIKTTEAFESKINIEYSAEEQTKEENILFNIVNTANAGNYALATTMQKDNLIMSIKPKTTTETLHEGQIVTYEIKVTNTSSETINNAVLSYTIPEGAVYTELTYAQGRDIQFTDNEELTNKEWNIEKIEPNETITKEVIIKIKEGTEQIVNKANLKNQEGTVLIETTTDPVDIKESKLSVMSSRIDNIEINLTEKDPIQCIVIIKNISNETMNNIEVSSRIPENTIYTESSEYNQEWSYNNQDNIISRTINTLQPNETKELIFEVTVDKLKDNETSGIIENSAIIKIDSDTYETNIFTSKVKTARWLISQKAEHSSTLKEGEQVKYVIEVKNIGERGSEVYVKDNIPEEIQLRKINTYINNELTQEEEFFEGNEIEISEYLEIGEVLKVEIEGVTFDLDDGINNKEIKNVAKIDLGDGEFLSSEEIVNNIVNDINPEDPEEPTDPKDPEDPEEPTDPKDPEDPEEPTEPTDPENPSEAYSISGLAWLDANKNGIRDNNEDILQGIKVVLLDKDGNVVKDKEGKEISTITTITGTYKFSDIEKGEYIVVFIYDTEKYALSKYQVEGATEEQNSDVISKQITIDDETKPVGATNIIKIENSDIKNIDIGLIENAKFDLSLEKYVAKVVVTNDTESVNYDFGEEKLAKIEIAAKKLAKTTILVQYEIKIKNEGDIVGYVSDIIDYNPKELTFNSEMNPDWYSDSEGKLHNITLTQEPLEAGKTKIVKLVLTKTLSNNSTGTIENIAEIGASTNLEGIKDIDSTAGNKKTGEDDIGNASLIISIKTGSPVLYIGIVLVSLLILGTGIYLVDKKVMKGGI